MRRLKFLMFFALCGSLYALADKAPFKTRCTYPESFGSNQTQCMQMAAEESDNEAIVEYPH